VSDRFDREYYRRFYGDGRSSVTSRAEMAARARLIAAYVEHVGCPVASVLDAGCGIGLLRDPLMRALPRASYVGLEYSDYLCDRYGWTRGSLADFTARQPFDLVVCYDVLQYLGDADAAKALANLARLCRGVLHFSALTKRDWKENADQSRTDPDVAMRSADWYRRRLRRNFREAGAGFWIRRDAPIVVWELETAG
jgi:2-polyprenyl-3-methyl-5-hydroxy-6-metoxy-1,4-benzoquinol methylase